MNKRYPFPKRFWVYLAAVFIFAILLEVNIFRTDSWTGDKPFSEFVHRDWQLFAVFIIEELIIVFFMFLFSFLMAKISNKRDKEIAADWEQNKLLGINTEDYEYVWFDFGQTERALIAKQENLYILYVDEYDETKGMWCSVDSESTYNSLYELKKALFFDFDFFCEENAELDKYSNEIFKEQTE